jgi:hypothetical protein
MKKGASMDVAVSLSFKVGVEERAPLSAVTTTEAKREKINRDEESEMRTAQG